MVFIAGRTDRLAFGSQPAALSRASPAASTLLLWMFETKGEALQPRQASLSQRPSVVLSAPLGPAAIQTLSLGGNDNVLGFKALRQAHHPRVLTSLVLMC